MTEPRSELIRDEHTISCPFCDVVFRTKGLLHHHLEIAFRNMYHDHLELQQHNPFHESVPCDLHAQLLHLQHCRSVAYEVAAEQGFDRGDVLAFVHGVRTLTHEEQRNLEKRTPALEISSAPSLSQVTVAREAQYVSIFNPNTSSIRAPGDFQHPTTRDEHSSNPAAPNPRSNRGRKRQRGQEEDYDYGGMDGTEVRR
jgi:hypothetical protein